MIEVEIWSDIACPFCYIGKKNFETVLQRFKHQDQVNVSWKSFELDPAASKSQNVKIHELLAKKYGQTPEWAQKMNQNLTEKGKAVGIAFQFEKVIPTNSFDAHRLLQLASQYGLQNQVSELLFSSYFIEGKDLALLEILVEIAIQAGLDRKLALDCLHSNQFANQVRADEGQAHSFQITGVPAFVFNQQYLISGAQPPEAFLEALQKLSHLA